MTTNNVHPFAPGGKPGSNTSAKPHPSPLEHEMDAGKPTHPLTPPQLTPEQQAAAVEDAWQAGFDRGSYLAGVQWWRYGVICGLVPGGLMACVFLRLGQLFGG